MTKGPSTWSPKPVVAGSSSNAYEVPTYHDIFCVLECLYLLLMFLSLNATTQPVPQSSEMCAFQLLKKISLSPTNL